MADRVLAHPKITVRWNAVVKEFVADGTNTAAAGESSGILCLHPLFHPH